MNIQRIINNGVILASSFVILCFAFLSTVNLQRQGTLFDKLLYLKAESKQGTKICLHAKKSVNP
jgi:hypothetical protein